jgi:hypothetical protein
MIGAAIVFFYGPPQPSFEQGVGIAVEDNTRLPDGLTAKEHDVETRRLRLKFLILSKSGLGLIFTGLDCSYGRCGRNRSCPSLLKVATPLPPG